MSTKERIALFTMILGAQGRGKTTLMLNAIKHKLSLGGRALVVLPDQSEKAWYPYYPVINSDELEEKFNPNFTGVCLIEWEDRITFPFLLKKFKAGILKDLDLVLDDPQYMLPPNRPEKEVIRLCSRTRQYGVDIWSNAHGYDQIPLPFIQYITTYGLMYTRGDITNRANQLGHHIPIMQRVNEIAGESRTNNPNYHYVEFFTKDGVKI